MFTRGVKKEIMDALSSIKDGTDLLSEQLKQVDSALQQYSILEEHTSSLSAELESVETCIRRYQEKTEEFMNGFSERLTQIEDRLKAMDEEYHTQFEWTRGGVYEVRDEARQETTMLQKLLEKNALLSEEYRDETHRHIDFTYRDIMVMLRDRLGVWSQKADLITDYPIAYESNDTISPHGTVCDNTRCPRFIRRCEEIQGREKGLKFLDLGCSGGGMVLDALLRGHYGLGLEGCDESLRQQRAEWRLIPEHLKTCDISRPFSIRDPDTQSLILFDVITAWEVLEHIPAKDIPQLLNNISGALADDGMFVGTIAAKHDIDPKRGLDWHVNIHPFSWWKDMFLKHGFKIENELFTVFDLARGVFNPPHCYEKPYDVSKANTEEDFYIVARKNNCGSGEVTEL